uniref:Homeobox domain-containing protein n=1 Tax=Panagrellus redivivus TaxID=6233 RepID=A0A7E4W8E6_PANRE
MFPSFPNLFGLLMALVPYSEELKDFKTPEEMQQLADKEGLAPFAKTLMDEDFASRWKRLQYKCCKVGESHSSMQDEVNNLVNAFTTAGSSIQHFGDFPEKPGNYLEDLRRYHEELTTFRMMMHNQSYYFDKQRGYVNNRLSVTMRKINQLEGVGSASTPELPAARHPMVPSASSTPEPPAKRMRSADPGRQPALPDRSLKAIDFFVYAHKTISRQRAIEKFSDLSTDERALFDNLENNQDKLFQC